MFTSKKCRARLRYQLQLTFDTEDEKDFLSDFSTIRKILSKEEDKQLDNLELIRTLMQMVHNRDNHDNELCSTLERPSDKQHLAIQPMLENAGDY
jgi:hypothetical protein